VFQNGVARDRPVRIETCGLPYLFLREKEKVERPGDEHDRDGDTNVHADARFFLAGDSAAAHRIAIPLLKQRSATSVTYFFNRDQARKAKQLGTGAEFSYELLPVFVEIST
jgi:hypothetical protein